MNLLYSHKITSPFKIKRKLVIEITVGLYILLFVYTGIAKLSNHEGFESVLSKSPLIEGHAHLTAWAVPIWELLIATLLIIPRNWARKIGMWTGTLTMLGFTIYIAYMMFVSPNLPCSCGGVIGYMSWKGHLIFNSCYTLSGFLCLYLIRKNEIS